MSEYDKQTTHLARCITIFPLPISHSHIHAYAELYKWFPSDFKIQYKNKSIIYKAIKHDPNLTSKSIQILVLTYESPSDKKLAIPFCVNIGQLQHATVQFLDGGVVS